MVRTSGALFGLALLAGLAAALLAIDPAAAEPSGSTADAPDFVTLSLGVREEIPGERYAGIPVNASTTVWAKEAAWEGERIVLREGAVTGIFVFSRDRAHADWRNNITIRMELADEATGQRESRVFSCQAAELIAGRLGPQVSLALGGEGERESGAVRRAYLACTPVD